MVNLFEFAKNVGRKLFNRDDDDAKKAEKVKESLAVFGIPGTAVTFKNGQVDISGAAVSAEQREKAILIAGNVDGVERVTADNLKAPAQTQAVEYYVIQSGDTLSKIAQRYYGNAAEYNKIFDANREVIVDADKIYPGQKIRIPNPRKAA